MFKIFLKIHLLRMLLIQILFYCHSAHEDVSRCRLLGLLHDQYNLIDHREVDPFNTKAKEIKSLNSRVRLRSEE